MEIETPLFIKEVFADIGELQIDVRENVIPSVFQGIFCEENKSHVDAVQPNLVGITLFMPEISLGSPRMPLQLPV